MNPIHQLFLIAFEHDIDFQFAIDPMGLGEDNGLPADVSQIHLAEDVFIGINMNRMYFRDNAPEFTDESVTLTLSFGALYRCTIPWSAIKSVLFTIPKETQPAPAPVPPKRGSHLRLVS